MNDQLKEHILYIRENSKFFRDLYQEVNLDSFELSNLPIINQDDYWSNNGLADNTVLTSNQEDGVVFKSGGTTGVPKSSYFTQQEWEVFTDDFAFAMDHLELKKGDRCANLFYSGDLYASFLFINKSVEKLKNKVVQFPVTGQTSLEETKKIIRDCKINVLFGVPTSLLNLAGHYESEYLDIDQIYYGGEPLFDDQREKLCRKFPNAHISSIGYASVDGGQLGFVDSECSDGEHKVFDKTIMEIIDPDTSEIIREEGRVGKLIYTNLTRRLMPIVRYPVGDMASWSVIDKKFKLLGRADEGARVGPVTVTRTDILTTLDRIGQCDSIQNIQLVISRKNGKDYLHVYLGARDLESLDVGPFCKAFYEAFLIERPMYLKEKVSGNIEDLRVSVVFVDDLKKNKRTGKLRLVIDERFA